MGIFVKKRTTREVDKIKEMKEALKEALTRLEKKNQEVSAKLDEMNDQLFKNLRRLG